jgi:hypothetical protein
MLKGTKRPKTTLSQIEKKNKVFNWFIYRSKKSKSWKPNWEKR